MTPIELRFVYKAETGKHALWKKDHDGREMNYNQPTKNPEDAIWMDELSPLKGVPTSEYGLWLEERLGNPSAELREKYYLETGEYPVRDYFGGGSRRVAEYLFSSYSLWLEEYALQRERVNDTV